MMGKLLLRRWQLLRCTWRIHQARKASKNSSAAAMYLKDVSFWMCLHVSTFIILSCGRHCQIRQLDGRCQSNWREGDVKQFSFKLFPAVVWIVPYLTNSLFNDKMACHLMWLGPISVRVIYIRVTLIGFPSSLIKLDMLASAVKVNSDEYINDIGTQYRTRNRYTGCDSYISCLRK